MSASAQLGICKIQLDPLICETGEIDPDIDPIVYCGATSLEITPILTEGLDLKDPSGIPNKNCVEIKIDPELDEYEIRLNTCSLFDPELDALLGNATDVIVNAAGDVIGSKAKKKSGESCICACGEAGCQNRIGVTVWHLNFCPDGSPHPDGGYQVQVFPALQFRLSDETITYNNELNGRSYIATAYENPGFGAGPGDIIPASEAPFDRCRYTFASDVCPPGGCDCGTCGEPAVKEALGRTVRGAARPTARTGVKPAAQTAVPSPKKVLAKAGK